MAKQFQPLTLQVTTSPRRLRAQLLAAWPRTSPAPLRLRAVKTITHHINDALPADYKGDISVFVSNEASAVIEPIHQGFLYHLTQQQIVTRQPIPKSNNTALLHVHFTTAQSADDNKDTLKNEEATPLSRIEQIKQWQKETIKSMFQAMADTALTMEAQTALRGTMAGLNRLGALLNNAKASHKLPQGHAKVAAQKTAARDIASTLSDLRSNLNLASSNGLKPPTKSQLALRQQLNKLDKIIPAGQKTLTKSAPIIKAAANIKSVQIAKTVTATKATAPRARIAPIIKTALSNRAAPIIKTTVVNTAVSRARIATTVKAALSTKTIAVAKAAAPAIRTVSTIRTTPVAKTTPQRLDVKTPPPRTARISVQSLRLSTVAKTYIAPRSAAQSAPIRVLARRVITPTRIVVQTAQRITQQPIVKQPPRYAAPITKTIITKIAERPLVLQKATPQTNTATLVVRTPSRFQISRPLIERLQTTPAIIAAHQHLRTIAVPVQEKTKLEPAKLDKATQPQTIPPQPIIQKDITPKNATLNTTAPPLTRRPTQSLDSKIPLRITRPPATYAGVLQISPVRHQTLTTARLAISPAITPFIVQHNVRAVPPLPQTRLGSFVAQDSLIKVAAPIAVNVLPNQRFIPVQPTIETISKTPVAIQTAPLEQPAKIILEKPKSSELFVADRPAPIQPPPIETKQDNILKGVQPIIAKPNYTLPRKDIPAPLAESHTPPRTITNHNQTLRADIIPSLAQPVATGIVPVKNPDRSVKINAPAQQAAPIEQVKAPTHTSSPEQQQLREDNILPFRQPDRGDARASAATTETRETSTVINLRDRLPPSRVEKIINAYVESDNRPRIAVGGGYSHYAEHVLGISAVTNMPLFKNEPVKDIKSLRPPENPGRNKYGFILVAC